MISSTILQRLKNRKEVKASGGLYHILQIKMSYNSNHIEGNSLNEEQTRYIFETNSFLSSEVILIDDIMEIKNHFKAFDYCIDIRQEPLMKKLLKISFYIKIKYKI